MRGNFVGINSFIISPGYAPGKFQTAGAEQRKVPTLSEFRLCERIKQCWSRRNHLNVAYKRTRNVGQCPTWWPPCRTQVAPSV